MGKKNMRRISILVTVQTAENLERLVSMYGYREIGTTADKLTREKMISLRTDVLMPEEGKRKQIRDTGVTARSMRGGPVTTQTRSWSARSASIKRLTIRNSDGSILQSAGLNQVDVLERLAAYEDIGLESCEINEKYAITMEFNKLRLKTSPVGLCKISWAETEGRCVVLSCKIEDTLNKYVNQARESEELHIKFYTATGFIVEKLLGMFVVGCVLQKPDYSEQLVEMANLVETTTSNELLKWR